MGQNGVWKKAAGFSSYKSTKSRFSTRLLKTTDMLILKPTFTFRTPAAATQTQSSQ